MEIILGIVVAVVAIVAAWWLLRLFLRPRESAEPRDDSQVPAPLKRGPRPASGAVALEEPYDDDNPDVIGRKS